MINGEVRVRWIILLGIIFIYPQFVQNLYSLFQQFYDFVAFKMQNILYLTRVKLPHSAFTEFLEDLVVGDCFADHFSSSIFEFRFPGSSYGAAGPGSAGRHAEDRMMGLLSLNI